MNIDYLNELRLQEIGSVLKRHGHIFNGKKVLEIGGGTGVQANEIKKISAEIVSLEIEETNYREHIPSHVTFYDGRHIPFPDNYFDVVYSSNVLEHIAHRDEFQKEIMRVLKKDGYALHIMPTHWWRLHEMLQNFFLFLPRIVLYSTKLLQGKTIPKLPLKAHIFGDKHGEFGGVFTEVYYFMPKTWKKYFKSMKWGNVYSYPSGIFYTGRLIFGEKLPISFRKFLARCFGSPVHIYIMQKR